MTSADAPMAPDATGSAPDEPRTIPGPPSERGRADENARGAFDSKPDVAAQTLSFADDAIDWVGMRGIAMPILFDGGEGEAQRCRAKVDAFVNLARADKRGIHMSRLYLLLNRYLGEKIVDARTLTSLLRAFVQSHRDLSDRARVVIEFEYLVRRTALRSEHRGWRVYPVSIEASLIDGVFSMNLDTRIVYSSTCPASLALSRHVAQQQFAMDFRAEEPLKHADVTAWLGSERGMAATPHAQRSIARVRVGPVPNARIDLIALIDRIEHSLGTAVQTAVKREDEQAFAQANAGNPMFCEDAARRIRRVLANDPAIAGFDVRVEHQESLHAHDAVAQIGRPFLESGSAGDHGF